MGAINSENIPLHCQSDSATPDENTTYAFYPSPNPSYGFGEHGGNCNFGGLTTNEVKFGTAEYESVLNENFS
ncbi:hypothetical protein GCM10028773_41200 [Spirosoma koreense]